MLHLNFSNNNLSFSELRVIFVSFVDEKLWTILLYREEVFDIIGAAIDVHKELGDGFLEPVYQESLEIELTLRKIPFEPQKILQLFYKDIRHLS